MRIGRRELIAGAAITAAARMACAAPQETRQMYGLIAKMTAVAGQRDALIAVLLESTSAMPGCLSYIIAKDPADDTTLWVTEVWDDKASHDASLKLPAVAKAIAAGKPMIAAFGPAVVTTPVGGHGIKASG